MGGGKGFTEQLIKTSTTRDREFSNVRFRLNSRSEGTVTQETAAGRKGEKKEEKTVDPRASAPLSPSDRFFLFFLYLALLLLLFLFLLLLFPFSASYTLSAHSVVTENGSSRDGFSQAQLSAAFNVEKISIPEPSPDTGFVTCGAKCLFFFVPWRIVRLC